MRGVLRWALVLAFVLCLTLTFSEAQRRKRRARGHRRMMQDRHRRAHPGERAGRGRMGHWRNRLRGMFGSNEWHAVDFLDGVGGEPFMSFDLGWAHGRNEDQAWWKGPNVCVSESEDHHNDSQTRPEMLRHFLTTSQTCDASETAYKCKFTQHTREGRREVTVVHQCCHGYSRQEGDNGCPRRVQLYNLVETAQKLGLTDFVRAVRLLRLTGELQEGNFTVFAPVNGAFGFNSDLMTSGNGIVLRDMPNVISVSEDAAEKAVEDLQDAILGHMVAGSVSSSQLEDEQVVETGHPEGSTIRINYFSQPEQVMMANCVPVVARDQMATNGVIHTIARAMKPVTQTLLDLVRTREDLSTLKTVLAAAEYVSTLNEEGSYTLLAPTNAAFDRMDARLRERLLRGDKKCLQKVLHTHLLPNVICSGVIKGEGRTPNLLHKYVNVTLTPEGKIFADGAQIVQTDIMATNGVMHVIDDVIVPEEALGFMDVLEKHGFTELLALVEKAGLTKTLDTTDNVTIFAPTNQAIQNLPESLKNQIASDPSLLREVLTFHVSPGVQECQRFHDNQLLGSLAGSDIRFNTFHMFPFHHQHAVRTAQCVPIQSMNVEACNGRINVIDDVMVPPKGNVVDVLALDKRFSTLVSLVKKAGLADALQAQGPFTVFAPNNEAFDKIDSEKLDALAKDPEMLADTLRRHVFENTLCCAGIFRGSWFARPQVRVLSGDKLKLSRDRSGRPKIGHAHVVTCDKTATNGNVLEIDSVLLRPTPRNWRFNPFARRDDYWP
ncbi:fasciclin-like protein precursor [Aplysia californica]|uniref:Fasciclin-like protein n=1 Tax=Aplysia californica TaxID=6500 RepID=Q8N0B2_APLCA|nr:fasciclin-like protein precursor [Aplysia californica]AAM28437.1 fasciclin-like protein [Aplysia californica]